MLEEAARVLHEALRAHAAGHQRQDRGSTLVNLAEALLSMAEREVPAQRIRQIEHAFMASSAALRTVVPADMAWLVNLERRSIE
jgi:CHASE3 domain sensor protein